LIEFELRSDQFRQQLKRVENLRCAKLSRRLRRSER
jgi:hypothetical protein